MLKYFAHEGVEHATAAEAANHAGSTHSDLPVILAVTAVIAVAAFVTVKLLSAADKLPPDGMTPKEKTK